MKKWMMVGFSFWVLSGFLYGQTSTFRLIVISDTHISNDEKKNARLEAFMDLLNEHYFYGMDFLVNTGDVCSSVYKKYYSDSLPHGYNRLAKAVEIHKRLDFPWYFVMGNHDYKIDSDRDSDLPFTKEEIDRMESLWLKVTGFRPFYSFIHKGWKFIILDSMHGRSLNRLLGEDQVSWLSREMETSMPVILFVHHPLKTDHFRIWAKPDQLITRTNEPGFFNLLDTHKDQIKGIFVGHGHMWVHDVLDGVIPVYETNSFGEDVKHMDAYLIECDQPGEPIKVNKVRLHAKQFLQESIKTNE